MIDTFTLTEFEAALPYDKNTHLPMCRPLGLMHGEFVWLMPVDADVSIFIRSSVGPNGISRSTGDDSIRAWLVETPSLAPLGSKVQRWITRQPGWQGRLLDMLRTLWGWRKNAGNCLDCSRPNLIFRNHSTKQIFCRCRDKAHMAALDENGRRCHSKTIF